MKKNSNPIIFLGLIISGLISLKLSVDLFSQAGTTTAYKFLYGGIAVALELLKLSLISQALKNSREGNDFSFYANAALFLVLSSVSVMGSIGSLQRDGMTGLQNSQAHFALIQADQKEYELNTAGYEKAVELIDQQQKADEIQLVSIQAEISQNNEAIAFYQSQARFQSNANPIKAQNESLRKQAEFISDRMSSRQYPETPEAPVVLSNNSGTSLTALAGVIASVSGITLESAQMALVVLFSVLLEVAMSVFFYQTIEQNVSLRTGEKTDMSDTTGGASGMLLGNATGATGATEPCYSEAPQKHFIYASQKHSEVKCDSSVSIVGTGLEAFLRNAANATEMNVYHATEAHSANATESTQEQSPVALEEAFVQVKEAIEKDALSPSKRQVMKQFCIGAEKAAEYFEALVQEGLIFKKGNRYFKVA